MSRRRRKALSPNLFPFLAVLVCTLGTLILLLALVSQDAKETAQEATATQTKSASIAAEDHRWQAEQLIEYRQSQTKVLDQKRSELAHLEDHLRRLRDDLAKLQFESYAAAYGSDNESTKKTQAKLVSLSTQISREKEMIRDLKEERAGRPPRVVIVPYKGSNGTDRRPIYIECTDQAVIIQPEGVRIMPEQLDGPLGPGNPLDAALRTVRTYWKNLDPDAPPPYPLLLVRPNGIYAYGACRIAMASWDDQFGYELVPANVPLAYPKPDKALETQLAMSIQEAVNRQHAKIANHSNSSRPGSLDPTGHRQSGGSAGPNRSINSSIAGDSGNAGSSNGSSNASNAFSSGRFQSDEALGNANGFSTPTDSLATAGNSLSGTGSLTRNQQGNSLLAGQQRTGGSQLSGSQFADNTGSGSGIDAATGAGREASLDRDMESRFGPLNGNGAGNNGNGDGSADSPGAANSKTGGDSPQSSSANATASNPLGDAGGTLANGQMQGGGTGDSMQAPPNGQTSASAMANPAMASNLQMPSKPFDPHEKTFSEQAQQTPSPNSNSAKSSSASSSPPVLRSGNNWAVPESTFTARGANIVRQMRLQCFSNRFVLMPDGKNSLQPQAFPIVNGQTETAVLELATVMRDRISSWGVAMQNGRWDPVLMVRVEPGAEVRFSQLQAILRDSGIRLEQESTP